MTRNVNDLFNLQGKTALVTGGSRGLGLQMAHALGEAGARVMLTSRKAADLEAAAAELKAAGIDAQWIAADCGQEADVRRLADETLARLPGVRSEGLRGGVLYWDGQFDDAQLVVSLMRTAWAPTCYLKALKEPCWTWITAPILMSLQATVWRAMLLQVRALVLACCTMCWALPRPIAPVLAAVLFLQSWNGKKKVLPVGT
jgi:gluconate 5-dehydrogenase